MCTGSVMSGKIEPYLCNTGGNLYWTCQGLCRTSLMVMLVSCLYRDTPEMVAHTFEVMLVTLFAAVPYTFLYVGDACIV